MQCFAEVTCGLCGTPGRGDIRYAYNWSYEFFCRDPFQCRENIRAKERKAKEQEAKRQAALVPKPPVVFDEQSLAAFASILGTE